MGRTVPTFTQVIEQEMQSWSKFRRGLRKEDQEILDDLFRVARMQLASSAYAARPIPFDSIVMSMLLAQRRMIRELEKRLRKCEGEETEEMTVRYDHADDHRMAV